MIRFKYSKGPIQSKIAIIVVLAAIWVLMVLFMNHPTAVERYYSGSLYLGICWVLHPVFNLFPFSVGDVFYILLIVYLLYVLIKIIRLLVLRRFRLMFICLLKVIIVVQALIVVFYIFWGLNYFRPSAAKRLNLQDTSYSFEDIKQVTAMLIDSANASRARLTSEDTLQNNAAIYQTAANAIDTLSKQSKYFPAIHPKIKSSLLTFFMNYLGTEGDYNPFTSEAQMNYQMPVFLRPFTACHEMTHQMGFGAEDEANFGGFVAGIGSHNRLLRYSAYYSGMEEFMLTVFLKDSLSYKKLKTNISPQVRSDRKHDRLYWKSFEGKAGIFGSILYDNYLKSNNQPQGLKTYNRMIRLVMAWYCKKEP
ncbi:uncharacterized protein DUF3810 [Mucilaginibacter gracilis]|uniref:Uncharacterized protein DUF3810 n=1 Tax=Mucilaginibacter gracilis TaxID=423350 RepID=A0A495J5A8_9SPHI|nr:DUF3810 domain-containing protein [Mucilaginibacter gracilis]RKR83901.1 uncharacterized protein DUF3810 [Mucilaginibacter gracilis]